MSMFSGPCQELQGRLFPSNLPNRQWIKFPAEGFKSPVWGVIYHGEPRLWCGMPLGKYRGVEILKITSRVEGSHRKQIRRRPPYKDIVEN